MSIILDGTNGENFPAWTTGTRPASPIAGQTGYNTSLGQLEVYNGTAWGSASISASGLPVVSGGTGQISALTQGGIVYSASTTAMGNTAAGTSGQALISAGTSAPSFGTLGIAGGGTNNASLAVTAGGVVYTDGSKLVNVGAGTSGQVLQSNGATAPTWATASSGGLGGMQSFTASGTFTIPTGKTVVKVTVVAGGGGCGGAGNGGGAGAGGGGGYSIHYLSSLTPGNTLTVTVGNGGTAGTSSGAGGSGGTSSVASGTQTITTVSATGGSGSPLGSGILGSGGSGGSGSGGTINGTASSGSAGAYTVYSNCPNTYYASPITGGGSLFGNNPNPNVTINGSGVSTPFAGVTYGSGAVGGSGGGAAQAGAAGKSGIVIFEY